MEIREKNALFDILTLFALIYCLIATESSENLFIMSCIFLGFTLLRFKATPLSPYFYIAPAACYCAISLSYINIIEADKYKTFFTCLFLGTITLSLTLRYSFRIDLEKYKTKAIRISIFRHLFFIALFIHASATIPLRLYDGLAVLKAISMISSPALYAIITGSIVATATKSRTDALILFLAYATYLFLINVIARDFGRISILDLFFLLFFIFFFSKRPTVRSIKSGSRKLVAFVFLAASIQLFLIFELTNTQPFGGDALIFQAGIETVNTVNDDHEPLMPIHNGLLVLIPESFWPINKPQNFNPSAWYIENVMGMDPDIYPWGVGITLFASSYLYFGYIGVIFCFFSLAIYIGCLSRLVVNPFWAGFLCYFMMRLPLATFRMDETFIVGTAIPTIIVIYIFSKKFKPSINKQFH